MKDRIYTWSDALGYYADIHGEMCEADEVVAASDARELMTGLENEIEVLRFAGEVQGERLTAEIDRLRGALLRLHNVRWSEDAETVEAAYSDARAALAGADQSDTATWQPIETAPRDGSHILAADLTPGRSGFGRFNGVLLPWQGVVHWWGVTGEEGFYLSSGSADAPVTATHWLPLPATRAANPTSALQGESDV